MLAHRRLTRRIQLALLTYILAAAALLATTLVLQLRHLASDQINTLGESLAEQLSEAIRRPMLNSDIISIQAILDQLVSQTPEAGRIAAYDGNDRLLSQSQHPGVGHEDLSTHEREIKVDNTVIGVVQVKLRSGHIASRYLQPLWFALATWLAVTGLFAWWLLRHSHSYSLRLSRLIRLLPGDSTHKADELTVLEQRLQPLIAGNDRTPGSGDSEAREQLLLAITVPELDSLQHQLNASHFDRILAALDDRVNHCLHIYDGERLHAQQGPLILSFDGQGEAAHWLRALSCARAINRLVPELGRHDGVALSARGALVACRDDPQQSPWRRDLKLRQDISRLLDTVHLAGEADMVIDTNAFDDQELTFCHLEPTTDGRGYRLTGFGEQEEVLFEQQLDFLQTGEQPASVSP